MTPFFSIPRTLLEIVVRETWSSLAMSLKLFLAFSLRLLKMSMSKSSILTVPDSSLGTIISCSKQLLFINNLHQSALDVVEIVRNRTLSGQMTSFFQIMLIYGRDH